VRGWGRFDVGQSSFLGPCQLSPSDTATLRDRARIGIGDRGEADQPHGNDLCYAICLIDTTLLPTCSLDHILLHTLLLL
jgi:hypothetical protein